MKGAVETTIPSAEVVGKPLASNTGASINSNILAEYVCIQLTLYGDVEVGTRIKCITS